MNENNNLIFESDSQNAVSKQTISESTLTVTQKKQKGNKGLIIFLILIIIGLTGFIVYDKFIANNEPKEEEKQTTQDDENKEEKIISRELTQDELNEFVKFFNEYSINGFVTQNYESVEEIRIDYIVYNGLGERNEVTKTEEDLYFSQSGRPRETSVHKVTRTQILNHIRKYAGIEDLTNFKWLYIKEYDAYYDSHGDARIDKINSCSTGKN